MSSEFTRKQGFKLKKKKPIYMWNVDGFFNKKKPIEYIVEMNIYYQRHRKKTEIDVIEEQKQKVILGILWLIHYNSEIDWKIREVKITRYSKECEKQ